MFIDSKYKIVLGSKSPRRQELIANVTKNYEVRIQDVDEVYSEAIPKEKVASYLAQLKANSLLSTLQENEIILCADTVVLLENEILGKPENSYEAKEMLAKLAAKKHQVITGCCLKTKSQELVFSCTTDVYFRPLNSEAIDYYVENFKPFDKAGSYGIQEWIGVVGIEKIDGCFYNVMGLPVSEVIEKLKTFCSLLNLA